MQTTFHKAVPDDVPAMACLLTLAWQTAYRGILSDAFLDSRNAEATGGRIRSVIETKPEFQYYVLEESGAVIGVAGLCPCPDQDLADTMEIRVFYVHPDRQGRGYGGALMRETLAAIKASGYTRTALWVLKGNRRAREFYERMGFTADGAEKAIPEIENALSVRYRHAKGL